MSKYPRSHRGNQPGNNEEFESQTFHATPIRLSKPAQSGISSRCSQIKSELDAVNAELASIRSGQYNGVGSVVSGASKASSICPQDSISNVSSRRGSITSRSHDSELSCPSYRSHGSSRSASRSGQSYAPRTPSRLSRISEKPSTRSSQSSYHSGPGRTICRYEPPGALMPAEPSSASSSQYSGTSLSSPAPRSYHRPSIRCRPDGSYYDAKLKISFEFEERSPDMYGCVNDGLRLDENGDYDIEDDLAPYRPCR